MATLAPDAASEWLSSFEALGGGYVRNSEGRLCFGWIAYGKTDEERRELRRQRDVLDTDHALGDAVDALIEQRERAL